MSPRVLSRLLARIVQRPQLSLVIDEVFGQGSTQIRFATVRSDKSRSFGELAAELRPRRIVPVGLRRVGLGGELILAPATELLVDCTGKDALIVLDDSGTTETTDAGDTIDLLLRIAGEHGTDSRFEQILKREAVCLRSRYILRGTSAAGGGCDAANR